MQRDSGQGFWPHHLWLLSEVLWAPDWPPGPPLLGAHLGQPRLGIQELQEAVGLVYEEVQTGVPHRLGNGHPGQQLPPTGLLGTASAGPGTEHAHMRAGAPWSRRRDGLPLSR